MKKIELIDKRKNREKYFLNEDGTIVAQIFDEDIHYLKNGKYEEIDNSLVKVGKKITNKNNNYKVEFNNESLFTIKKGNYYINIIVNDIKKYNPKPIKGYQKIHSYLKYDNILNDIDFVYELLPDMIKENIILKTEKSSFNDITFKVDTNLELETNSKGTILAKSNDKIIFEFNSPFMFDSKGEKCDSVNYDLINNKNDYLIKLVMDKEWLLSDKRIYPITIDPIITNYGNNNNVYDTYIFEGDSSINRGSMDILKAGVERTNNRNVINRTLLKFDLPSIGTGSQVVKAKLNLIGYITSPLTFVSDTMVIHRITQSWEENTASWNTMNDKYDPRIESCFESTRTWNSYNNTIVYAENTADLTDLVQRWYTDLPNYGIMIMANREVYKNNLCQAYYSKNNTVQGDNPKPILEIVYRNQNGIESYMKYFEHKLNVGNTFINSYNGNLTTIFNVGNTLSKKLSAELGIVYNTNDVVLGTNCGLGIGYKFNYYQTIAHRTIDEVDYLEYMDEDGTLHYFRKYKEVFDTNNNQVETISDGNTYYDEDGLDMSITETDTEYTIKDKSNSSMIFAKRNNIGYFSELIDINDNRLKIYYDNENRIIKVEDGSSEEINISYLDNKITINSSEIFELNYLNGLLISIINPNAETANIVYDNNNLISIIEDYNGIKLYFQYYDETPYRVRKSGIIGINNSLGYSFDIQYGKSSTTIIDNNENKTTFTFNNFGSVASMVSLPVNGLLKDAYGSNEFYGEEFQYKNKMSYSTTPLKHINNLLTNTSFEDNTLIFESDNNANINITNLYAKSGNKSLAINASNNGEYTYTHTSVEKNKYYTFSCYIKNECDIKIRLSYFEGNDEIIIDSSVIHPNDDFIREDLNVFYSNLATSDLYIKIILLDIGNCYLDDIQLEEGKIANCYNFIENSNFENGMQGWTFEKYSDSNSFSSCNIVDVADSTKALKISMNPECSSDLSKIFSIKGKAGDTYTVSFWYKNEGICYDPNPEEYTDTSNGVVLIYYPENTNEGHDVDVDFALNPNKQEWQFYSETFVAEEDFVNVGLFFFQSMNANNLYITNICLYKNVPYENFNYDKNGNLTMNHELNNSKTDYIYDSNNNLIKSKDDKNKEIVYEYDKNIKGRFIRNFNNNDITSEFEYDSYGNQITNKIVNKSQSSQIEQGLYIIRNKGCNDTLYLSKSKLLFRNDKYVYDRWFISVVNDETNEIKINHSIINNSFISLYSDALILSSDSDALTFILEKNADKSYKIKLKNNNKYLKLENNKMIISELENDNSNFDFFFEKPSVFFIESDNKYYDDSENKKLEIDSELNEIHYNLDQNTKLLNNKIDSRNNKIQYSYDNKKRITKVKLDKKEIEYEYYNNNSLKKIKTPTVEYNFEYDDFLNPSVLKIGNDNCVSYNYNRNEISAVNFPNNDTINYEYDSFDRLKRIIKSNDSIYYTYDYNGNLSLIESPESIIKFRYDESKRLDRYYYNDFKINYKYDTNNNVISKNFLLNSDNHSYIANYDETDDIVSETLDSTQINYTYDKLGRINTKSINNGINIELEYNRNGKRTSNTIKNMVINNAYYKYKYDKMNNITSSYLNGEIQQRYVYDQYNRLVKCIDFSSNLMDIYKYDLSNNIISIKTFDIDSYSLKNYKSFKYDNNYKDKLIKINNTDVLYDLNNNPIRIGNDILEWENGRELKSYINCNYNCEYTYDYNGNRTSKTINGIKTNYYLEKNQIVIEKTGNNVIYYLRDSGQNLIGFKYQNNIYYYKKNILNDIIGIFDSNYNEIVSYKYDSWGNLIGIYDYNGNDISNDLSNIGNINPYRYRSYYYDKETGLYYLSTRYYNPKWCRFISPDHGISSIGEIDGYNLFEYAICNPINISDEDGMWPKWAKALAVGAAVIGVLAIASAVTIATGGAGCAAAVVATSALKGALIGGAIGAVAGGTGNVIVNRVKTGSWKNSGKKFLEGFSYGFAAGAITGAVVGGGKGVHNVVKAAKNWSPGSGGKSALKSMNLHYKKHVINEGLTKNYDVIKYTNDAINFANRNRSVLEFKAATKAHYLDAWRLEYTAGQGGWFTSDGKIITFWLINHLH